MAITALQAPQKFKVSSTSGGPLNGGKVYTYLAGTTTPTNTYADAERVTTNTNPVILDARGEANIFLDPAINYKFVVQDSTGASVYTQDNISGKGVVSGVLDAKDVTYSNASGITQTVQKALRRTVYVDDYGSNDNPGTTDMTSAIASAVAAAGQGKDIVFQGVAYKTTSFINAENLRGITFAGSSGQYGFSGTRIVSSHTGKSILSLVGSLFCNIENISLEGDTAAKPKTGLLLGRSSAASASNHTFTNLHVQGFYSVAGVYNIASEENTFLNCYILPNAAPLAGLYMCQADGQAGYTIGGLTSSSMECNTFIGGAIGNGDDTAGSTGIYLDTGVATGHHVFLNTFMSKNGGDSFIKIRLGAIDGQNTEFPITFIGLTGEIGAAAPTSGIHISSSGNFNLVNFTAKCRFNGGTYNFLCDGAGASTLIGADISTPWTAAPFASSVFQRIQGSKLNLQNDAAITIGNIAGSDLTYRAAATITTDGGGNTLRDITGTIFKTSPFTSAIVTKEISPTYGANISIDASLANVYAINVSNGAGFTILNPTNSRAGQRITIRISNNSGGVMGAVGWGGNYKMAALANPANGFSKSLDFEFNGFNWIESSRTPSDVPN